MQPFIGTYTCHDGGQNQFFAFAQTGHILIYMETMCLGPSAEYDFVNLQNCNQTDDTQLWHYNKHVSIFSMCLLYTKRYCMIRWNNFFISSAYSFLLIQTKQISHVNTGLCLRNESSEKRIQLDECSTQSSEFQWMLNGIDQ